MVMIRRVRIRVGEVRNRRELEERFVVVIEEMLMKVGIEGSENEVL